MPARPHVHKLNETTHELPWMSIGLSIVCAMPILRFSRNNLPQTTDPQPWSQLIFSGSSAPCCIHTTSIHLPLPNETRPMATTSSPAFGSTNNCLRFWVCQGNKFWMISLLAWTNSPQQMHLRCLRRLSSACLGKHALKLPIVAMRFQSVPCSLTWMLLWLKPFYTVRILYVRPLSSPWRMAMDMFEAREKQKAPLRQNHGHTCSSSQVNESTCCLLKELS